MVNDARAHEAEDKKRREEVEVKNRVENLAYQMEKLLKENKEKLSAATVTELEALVQEAHQVRERGSAEEVKAALEKLEKASHKAAEELYKAAGTPPGGGAGPAGRRPAAAAGEEGRRRRRRRGVQAGLASRRCTSPSSPARPASSPPGESSRRRDPGATWPGWSTRSRWRCGWAGTGRRSSTAGGAFPATDVVVPRIAPSISQYGLAVVNHLQLLGLPVLNGAPAIGLARNKMRVLQLLSASGVKVPRTVMASEPSGLREMVRHVGGLPVLVKLLRGNEKTGVIVCESRQALESALEAILRLGQNTMVQQYVRGRRGGDLRAFVVGGRALAALRRRPRVGRLSRNLGQGARFEGAALDADAERAAVAAARVDRPRGLRGRHARRAGRARGSSRCTARPGIREAEEACGVDLAGRHRRARGRAAGRPGRWCAGRRRARRGPRRAR